MPTDWLQCVRQREGSRLHGDCWPEQNRALSLAEQGTEWNLGEWGTGSRVWAGSLETAPRPPRQLDIET